MCKQRASLNINLMSARCFCLVFYGKCLRLFLAFFLRCIDGLGGCLLWCTHRDKLKPLRRVWRFIALNRSFDFWLVLECWLMCIKRASFNNSATLWRN